VKQTVNASSLFIAIGYRLKTSGTFSDDLSANGKFG